MSRTIYAGLVPLSTIDHEKKMKLQKIRIHLLHIIVPFHSFARNVLKIHCILVTSIVANKKYGILSCECIYVTASLVLLPQHLLWRQRFLERSFCTNSHKANLTHFFVTNHTELAVVQMSIYGSCLLMFLV